ncbi:hypothetical protein AWC38_SpisGene19552 [Stylophora pistillata]|uniref:Uncharacterized protein n=1 Tax=Stylophora pistillata TaxID=50429 RepID=A0A2B4RCV5_STYPI|nr:hypothetical protein AWC38_SpisGene19552 [Stylophora pistillata]
MSRCCLCRMTMKFCPRASLNTNKYYGCTVGRSTKRMLGELELVMPKQAFLLFLPDFIFNLREECEREERREASTSTDAENNDSVSLLTLPIPTQSQQANSQIIREECREKELQSRVNKSGLTHEQKIRYGSTDAASANMDAENNDSVPPVTAATPTQNQ